MDPLVQCIHGKDDVTPGEMVKRCIIPDGDQQPRVGTMSHLTDK